MCIWFDLMIQIKWSATITYKLNIAIFCTLIKHF
jgi:hypothetical protein